MHSFVVGVALCLCFAIVQSQERQGYRDPCHSKRCGDYGCCVRRDPYYVRNRIFYRRAICACDEHYYYHRRDDVCRHSCYQNTCHRQYATCYAKGRGEQYHGSDRNNIYLDEYYYCQCNDGYRGNGRRCRKIDPCANADCHQHATCHSKRVGSTDYHNYDTYKGYVQNAYSCRCRTGYYGNGRQCTHGCNGNTCHAQYATCFTKDIGLGYPGSNRNRIYSNNYYYCQCNEGYRGNGRRCSPIDPCKGHDCHQYAACIPKALGLDYPGSRSNKIYRNNYYYCQCNRGYTGSGRRCTLRDPCRNANCHQHATCHAKASGSINYYNYPQYTGYVSNNYFCRCRDNYYGNGRQCTPHCAPNSCHSSAVCVPKPYGSIDYPTYNLYPSFKNQYFYCNCPRGVWNGFRCVDCSACADSRFARCIPKRCGSTKYPGYGNDRYYASLCYYCECKRPTYFGNGRSCRRASG